MEPPISARTARAMSPWPALAMISISRSRSLGGRLSVSTKNSLLLNFERSSRSVSSAPVSFLLTGKRQSPALPRNTFIRWTPAAPPT
jgi:hypothetical protein